MSHLTRKRKQPNPTRRRRPIEPLSIQNLSSLSKRATKSRQFPFALVQLAVTKAKLLRECKRSEKRRALAPHSQDRGQSQTRATLAAKPDNVRVTSLRLAHVLYSSKKGAFRATGPEMGHLLEFKSMPESSQNQQASDWSHIERVRVLAIAALKRRIAANPSKSATDRVLLNILNSGLSLVPQKTR